MVPASKLGTGQDPGVRHLARLSQNPRERSGPGYCASQLREDLRRRLPHNYHAGQVGGLGSVQRKNDGCSLSEWERHEGGQVGMWKELPGPGVSSRALSPRPEKEEY